MHDSLERPDRERRQPGVHSVLLFTENFSPSAALVPRGTRSGGLSIRQTRQLPRGPRPRGPALRCI